MRKLETYFLVILPMCMLTISVLGKPGAADVGENKSIKMQLILHKQGKAVSLNDRSPYFKDVSEGFEKLFAEADSSPRLIMSRDRLDGIKRNQTALELIFSQTQTVKLKTQQSVHYTKLLIPLTGEFADGTMFFAGTYEHTVGEKAPDYVSLLEYGSINFVRNTRGIHMVKESLKKIGAEPN